MRVREATTWLAAPLLLVVVATVQLRNVAVDHQSSWSGAGFGMFATFDAEQNRTVRITVTVDGDDLVLVREGDVLSATARLRVRPSEAATRSLAEDVLAMRFTVDADGHARASDDRRSRRAGAVTVDVLGVALRGSAEAPTVESVLVRSVTVRR